MTAQRSMTVDLDMLRKAGATWARKSQDRYFATLALRQEILKAHESGASLRQIAEASGLSHQRVHQIVTKGENQ